MRAVVVVSLMLALGGCQTVRSGLGVLQKTADKGVTVGGRTDRAMAPAGSAGSETTTGAPGTATAAAKTSPKDVARPALPNGLIGDTEHHSYSSDAPKN